MAVNKSEKGGKVHDIILWYLQSDPKSGPVRILGLQEQNKRTFLAFVWDFKVL